MKKLLLAFLSIVCMLSIIPINNIHAETYTQMYFKKELVHFPTLDSYIALTDENKPSTFNSKFHYILFTNIAKENGKYYLYFTYNSDTKKQYSKYLEIETARESGNNIIIDSNKYYSVYGKDEYVIKYELNKKFLNKETLYFVFKTCANKNGNFEDREFVKIKNPFCYNSIEFEDKEITLRAGSNQSVDVSPKGKDYYIGKFTFTSSDTSVAAPQHKTATGVYVNTFDAGTSTITAKSITGKTAKLTVHVVKDDFPFYDVNPNTWYRGTIEEVYKLGLMSGAEKYKFKPNANMTRAMVASVFHRMEGSKPTAYEKLFSDVTDGKYYSGSVTWAKQKGVINGYEDGTFKPNKNVTREEMVTMIYNFAKYKGKYRAPSTTISQFKDHTSVSPYAKESMKWAVQNGLISGKDNGTRLDPKGTATRAECAKMLLKAYNLIYKK